MLKKEVEAKIYLLSAAILLGKATKDEVEKIVQLASKHNLLALVKQEFSSLTDSLSNAKSVCNSVNGDQT